MREFTTNELMRFYNRNYNIMDLKVVNRLYAGCKKQIILWTSLLEKLPNHASFKVEQINKELKCLQFIKDNHKQIVRLQLDITTIETL